MKKLLAKFSLSIPYVLFYLLTIFVVGFLSIKYLPFTPSFPYYNDISSYGRSLASLAHFDGLHYLRLISKGYDDTGSQAFFPLYPLLVRSLSFGFMDPLIVAVVLNIIFLLVSLYVVGLDLKIDKFKRFLLLFLSFPASFFLVAVYTESFFILLVVLFFHFTHKQNYLLSAIIAGIASGTRLVGSFLAVSLLIELVRNRQTLLRSAFLLFISISGLLGYMYFLFTRFGDPLMFIHVQSLFGASRSDGEIILLPQVIYRYLRMLVTVNPVSILYFRVIWELLTFIISLIALYVYRHKMSLSALIFCLCAILLPTLSGTLSSFPRYLLVCVPLFVALGENLKPRHFWPILVIQYGILIVALALFVQGIFIA